MVEAVAGGGLLQSLDALRGGFVLKTNCLPGSTPTRTPLHYIGKRTLENYDLYYLKVV